MSAANNSLCKKKNTICCLPWFFSHAEIRNIVDIYNNDFSKCLYPKSNLQCIQGIILLCIIGEINPWPCCCSNIILCYRNMAKCFFFFSFLSLLFIGNWSVEERVGGGGGGEIRTWTDSNLGPVSQKLLHLLTIVTVLTKYSLIWHTAINNKHFLPMLLLFAWLCMIIRPIFCENHCPRWLKVLQMR